MIKSEAFLSDFKCIKSYHPLGDPIGSISGEAIRIIYPNGSIELITDYGIATVINGETDFKRSPLIPMILLSCSINILKILGIFFQLYSPTASDMHFVRDMSFGRDMRYARWKKEANRISLRPAGAISLLRSKNITPSRARHITFQQLPPDRTP